MIARSLERYYDVDDGHGELGTSIVDEYVESGNLVGALGD